MYITLEMVFIAGIFGGANDRQEIPKGLGYLSL